MEVVKIISVDLVKVEIQFDDFDKVDFWVGLIKEVGKVKGVDKLLKFIFDDGMGGC